MREIFLQLCVLSYCAIFIRMIQLAKSKWRINQHGKVSNAKNAKPACPDEADWLFWSNMNTKNYKTSVKYHYFTCCKKKTCIYECLYLPHHWTHKCPSTLLWTSLHCLDKHIISNQGSNASFLRTHRWSQRGPDEGKCVAYWDRFIQIDSISSYQLHTKCAKLCTRVFSKPLRMYWTKGGLGLVGASNEAWIIPGAKGSITARLSPRSSIWFISSPPAFQI